MDSIDQTAKLIKQQADSIEAIVVEHITTLYSERRRARKIYQEEQTWLNNQFQQVKRYFYDRNKILFYVLYSHLLYLLVD